MDLSKHVTDSVKKSTQEFLKNTEFVQAHVDFCDSLIENGYNLEDAIKTTDSIFEALKQEKTY